MKSSYNDILPIIYHPKYNISFLGIENLHPFDTKKYKKVYNYLRRNLNINKNQFIKPSEIPPDTLLTVHTQDYLHSLESSFTIANILEIPQLKKVPNFILKNRIIKPMLLAASGTVLGVKTALEYGWSINLSGGYHHAKSNSGEGFCIFADIPIALNILWQEKPDIKVLIVDLDAHQGNGISTLLGHDKRVAILDMYNSKIYPNDFEAKSNVSYNISLPPFTDDEDYLYLLKKWLPIAIKDHEPNLLIYNAGTDIYEHDPLGGLSITESGIIQRDEIVFRTSYENNIPILMLLSGGYHKESGKIIGKSIENILKTVLKYNTSHPSQQTY